jgi:hypothetical protein
VLRPPPETTPEMGGHRRGYLLHRCGRGTRMEVTGG